MRTTDPFEVRDVRSSDLPDVIRAHQSAFPGFLMTMLGPRFLGAYYQTVLDYPDRIFLAVVASDDRLRGFIAGFVQPQSFYRLFNARKKKVIASGLLHIAVRPAIWRRVLENMGQVQARSEETEFEVAAAELASICVNPNYAGAGVGTQLVEEFVNRARQQSVESVILTTDALNNDAVNLFYQKLGFSRSGTSERAGGRLMNHYEIMTNLRLSNPENE